MKKTVEVNYVGMDEFFKIVNATVELGKMGHYAHVQIYVGHGKMPDFNFGFMKGRFDVKKEYDIFETIYFDDPDDIEAANETDNYKAYSKLLDQIGAFLTEDHEDEVVWPKWREAGEGDE